MTMGQQAEYAFVDQADGATYVLLRQAATVSADAGGLVSGELIAGRRAEAVRERTDRH